jgi:hypothetical protein
MSNLSTESLARLLRGLNVGVDDILGAAALLGADGDAPWTLQRFYDEKFLQACPARSLPTYRPHVKRMLARYGDSFFPGPSTTDFRILREEARTSVHASLRAAGRPVNEDRDGRGAAENFVRAVRCFHRLAVDDNRMTAEQNPAARLEVPNLLLRDQAVPQRLDGHRRPQLPDPHHHPSRPCTGPLVADGRAPQQSPAGRGRPHGARTVSRPVR